jgi:hypothetical protein
MLLTRKIFDGVIIRIIIAASIAYYMVPVIFQSKLMYLVFIGGCFFVLFFFNRIEHAFYFLLIIRSVLDLFLYEYSFAGFSIPQLVGGLFSVLVAVYFVFSRYNIFALGINRIYGCFIFFSFLPVFLNKDFVLGMGYWLRWLQGFLVLNLTVLIIVKAGEAYKRKINMLCWGVILSIVLPYVLFTYNYINGITVVYKGVVRYFTYGTYENEFSYYMLAIFPYCLFLYSIADRSSKKIAWLISLLIMLYTIYINNTRNVWIGVSVILLVWAVVKKQYKVLFILLLLGALIVAFTPNVAHRMNDVVDVLDVILYSDKGFFEWDPTLMNRRIGLWQNNLRYFLDESSYVEKLVGNGVENLKKNIVRVISGGARRGDDEHNNYLILLMNTGLIGTTLYFVFFFKLFHESFKLLKETNDKYFKSIASIYIPVLCSYIVCGMGTHLITKLTYIYFFSILGGIVIAGNIITKREKESSSSDEGQRHYEKG